MNTFLALLKREYWEHRGAFLRTPLIIGGVLLLIILLVYLTAENFDMKLNSGQAIELGAKKLDTLASEHIQTVLDIFMLSTASIYHLVLFFILFFFLLGSLYDDRKDGSILFWKSLPISDTQTVLSKLITATLVAPALFIFGVIVSHLACFILISLFLLFNGVNPFTILWANADFIGNWGAFIVGCVVQALWALPIYGWLLLSSSYSKRRPFLLAVFVPIMAGFVWYWYNALANQDIVRIGVFKTIGTVVVKGITPFTSGNSFDDGVDFNAEDTTPNEVIQSMLSGLSNSTLWYGVVFGILATALAIYVRRYRNTT